MTSTEFNGENFLLQTKTATELYHSFASGLPIIDYHNHLPPQDVAENRQFQNLTEIWLEGDHYKWRAMRTNGVAEKYCTGNVSPEEKFKQWAATVSYTMRNPLYHWTHLELKKYFGISRLLTPESAMDIYNQCSEQLRTKEFTVQALLKKMKVEVICTTDDPADDLRYHIAHANSNSIKMLPAFRPDLAYAFEDTNGYKTYLKKLGEAASIEINSLSTLLQALEKRADFFHSHGCRVADHGLEYMPVGKLSLADATKFFERVLKNEALSRKKISGLKSVILNHLCRIYHAKGWVQQFHVGALRNNNARLMRELGPNTGFDSVGDFPQAQTMAKFFSGLDNTNQLAKTIIYNLNPADNSVFATMAGNFNDGSVVAKMQWGASWWFLDQKDGIEDQLNTLSNMGLLSRFVGMLTDSRSFLSFPRHEYFRRVLCNLLGRDIEAGLLPNDLPVIGKMVQDIGYHNTKNYFGF